MNAGLVRDVPNFPVTASMRVADNLAVDDRDPSVRLEALGMRSPPGPQLFAAEPYRAFLVEIRPVARRDQGSDRRRVVQRRGAKDELVQSGWPDSNRRLPAPKAGTLTRLSYTPRVPEV